MHYTATPSAAWIFAFVFLVSLPLHRCSVSALLHAVLGQGMPFCCVSVQYVEQQDTGLLSWWEFPRTNKDSNEEETMSEKSGYYRKTSKKKFWTFFIFSPKINDFLYTLKPERITFMSHVLYLRCKVQIYSITSKTFPILTENFLLVKYANVPLPLTLKFGCFFFFSSLHFLLCLFVLDEKHHLWWVYYLLAFNTWVSISTPAIKIWISKTYWRADLKLYTDVGLYWCTEFVWDRVNFLHSSLYGAVF